MIRKSLEWSPVINNSLLNQNLTLQISNIRLLKNNFIPFIILNNPNYYEKKTIVDIYPPPGFTG
jgi:hypothetical protein